MSGNEVGVERVKCTKKKPVNNNYVGNILYLICFKYYFTTRILTSV